MYIWVWGRGSTKKAIERSEPGTFGAPQYGMDRGTVEVPLPPRIGFRV